jgi:hypothetical protein
MIKSDSDKFDWFDAIRLFYLSNKTIIFHWLTSMEIEDEWFDKYLSI